MASDPAYAKGYAAGRRRVAVEEREEFRRAVFLAVLPEIVRSPWGRKVGDEWKPLNTAPAIVSTAWDVADAAVAKRFI